MFWLVTANLLLALVAVSDLILRRIPNRVLLLLLAGQLGWHLWCHGQPGRPWALPAAAWLGAGVALVVFWPLWRWRAMGAGDVKLLVVLGAMLGLPGLFWAWLVGSVLAGLHSLVWLWWRQAPLAAVLSCSVSAWVASPPTTAWARWAAWRVRHRGKRQGAPYGMYLVLGAWSGMAAPGWWG